MTVPTALASTMPVKRIVIVGGGSAGWIVAGLLASRYPARGENGMSITLLESPAHPPIGVGEGTWPTIRTTLRQIGVTETDFVRQCEASFKQGSLFAGWVDGNEHNTYLHPFTPPVGFSTDLLAPYWLEDPRAGSPDGASSVGFAQAVCFQTAPCLVGRAPKRITSAEYAGACNYAYHLNAGRFGGFLQAHCTSKLGVEHVLDEIVGVESDDAGDISRLKLRSGATLGGDLFVDCTGLASLLIGKHYGTPFVSKKDVLFCDRAWAAQVSYPSEQSPIGSATVSTAQTAGWIWDIGLPTRRGIGHVYASGYQSDEAALEQLQAYLAVRGLPAPEAGFRRIEINPGYRREFWVRNCVAVGLAAGFLEPLEASAIVMIELSAQLIANLLPRRRDAMAHAAALFNDTFRYRWERIIDFLKLHYVLSRRTDGEFWLDNRRASSIPDSLAAKLDFWQSQCPWLDDFAHREEIFSAASYQYILYGMGFNTAPAPWALDERMRQTALRQFAAVRSQAQELCATLPANRELLDRVRQYGFQKV